MSSESDFDKIKNPAHVVYVELATRVSTRRLHYRSGDEETVMKSIHSLFALVRKLMAEHPDDLVFHKASLILLNGILRPYTARWHGWMTQDGDKTDKDGNPVLTLRDPAVRRKFREELIELQSYLIGASEAFATIKEGKIPEDVWLKENPGPEDLNSIRRRCEELKPLSLGGDVRHEMRSEVPLCRAGTEEKSGKDRIENDIVISERNEILRRRELMGRKVDGELMDVTGLALSGGGIRSATFCLGIVQALHAKGLFNQMDYLSTVSGGGYLGTFLSSYLGSIDNGQSVSERVDETLGKSNGTGGQECSGSDKAEPGPLRHLRNNSKYLLNGGMIGKIRIAGVLVTGFFSSALILITIPLACAWLALGVKWINGGAGILPFRKDTGWLAFILGVLLCLWIGSWLLKPLFQRLAVGETWKSPLAKLSRWWEIASLAFSVSSILFAVLIFMPWMVSKSNELGEWFNELLASKKLPEVPEWLVAAATGVLASLGAVFGNAGGRRRILAKVVFYITGPLFFFLMFLYFANQFGVGTADPSSLKGWVAATIGLFLWIFFFLNINTFAPHRYYRDRLCECYLVTPKEPQRSAMQRMGDWALHGKCVERDKDETSVAAVRSIPLEELNASGAAPYHLINAVLNAESSRNSELRGRNGDFFLFSRHWCGSPLTGYITTKELGESNPGLDLGTAMAISGAAASTNMGWKTLRQFRFLMTLFNVRLGYWMRRPGSGLKVPPVPLLGKLNPLGVPGPWYFIREMLGLVHERSRFVNLSDGGHIENLAAYELLRRQCKFIVCVDAGMEPGMECEDLMRLERYASIDFGIRMHFDLSDLTVLPTKYSRAYAILVKIDYKPGAAEAGRETSDKLGWMLYLKLAVTGTEPRHVLDYRRQNPAFPHQTTGDQFYDEAQFESYRALGECALLSLFREEIIGSDPAKIGTVEDWFKCLAANLLTDNDEVFISRRRSAGSP